MGGTGTQMPDTDDLALWYALNRLMTNYWAEVDSNGRAQAHEAGCCGARAIWLKLDCLNPNLQQVKIWTRRKRA